ncbi:tRNA 2-selenouridine(34) synthase MnmH [Spirosoma utsteinense]|uniref:tRNA 2-selenouridine synthase n=1 Tax=Spirosoma utsteinense TaxID=2585773 RepID=A0ABR6W4Q7_9BACT|nr:tRNA 2-selenouridine(34) synthase MnmH [Spirosoma utsteinense]MBC3785384.1 tRNA 2-selenouridine synthase [Spirosoma utsteinense]MBC3791588.1 tRNA 2-selenouridine synthase [Spirosoma utsteinense]
MVNQLSVDEFLAKAQSLPVVDVRSPGEYDQAHIPGAVSIPLFDNEERALVGTKYKNAGKDSAVLLGLDLVGSKLAGFVKQSKKLNPQTKEVLVHCWRGGMRSGSFAWLLDTAGLTASTLAGGYKAYRSAVLSAFAEPRELIILGGKTGSGKTDILKELARQGEQVIDLEGLAHHKGSTYGAIGQLPQPATEQYENLLFGVWRTLDRNRRIWIEDESRNVGSCFVPMALWQQMRAAPVAFVDVPKAVRVQRLVAEYTGIDHSLLVEATQRISKRLGGKVTKDALEALTRNDYAAVADLTLDYYDKAYLHGLSQRDQAQVHPLDVSVDSPAETARWLIDWAREQEISQSQPTIDP